MSAPTKLTKKQKKGIAFRDRKQGKVKSKDGAAVDNDVPVAEDQDAADLQVLGLEAPAVAEKAGRASQQDSKGGAAESKQKGKGKAVADETREGRSTKVLAAPAEKKRKRESEEKSGEPSGEAEVKQETPKRKKRKGSAADSEGVESKSTAKKNDMKQRFILFVGNLKYTTSLEAIQKHFAACDPPPSIRLLTPKPSDGKRPNTNKSKGCAFLEFTHRNALQQALKLHQSNLDGRMINVELTAGGGGKSDTRITKVKERNKELEEQRKKQLEKLAAGESGDQFSALPVRPQRYSATSGLEQVPVVKRTWTVGDADDGETHRGGKKHSKGKKDRRPGKEWGTGVNAIPVG